MAPRVSNDDRKRLEEAIAAALLLLYRGHAKEALQLLDPEAFVIIPQRIVDAIVSQSSDGAAKVRDGINERIQAAIDSVPDGQSPELAIRQAINDINAYNAKTLFPYFDSWARHQALLDIYQNTPDPNDPSITAAEGTLWVWEQMTGFEDECQDAANASPASLSDLLSITGDAPPVHRNCQCSLSPE